MMGRYRWISFFVVAGLLVGCATKGDFERLEKKVDRLIQATNKSTLEEIFGEQASEINLMVNDLSTQQKQNFENLQQEYANGSVAVDEVRQKMLGILGNNNRVVSTQRGIYVRNLEGSKLNAIPQNTKIENCRLLAEADVPAAIREKQALNRFSWGQGGLNGETVLFPWELTISLFTKEVAEQTAVRTAEEFIKMGGEKQWQRPIKIQISTEKDDKVKITTNEEHEIYFDYQNANPTAANTDAPPGEENRNALTSDEGMKKNAGSSQ
jgi:hypothetical protein